MEERSVNLRYGGHHEERNQREDTSQHAHPEPGRYDGIPTSQPGFPLDVSDARASFQQRSVR